MLNINPFIFVLRAAAFVTVIGLAMTFSYPKGKKLKAAIVPATITAATSATIIATFATVTIIVITIVIVVVVTVALMTTL